MPHRGLHAEKGKLDPESDIKNIGARGFPGHRSFLRMLIKGSKQINWKFAEERPGIEQHYHSEPVRFPGVGLPIEFRAIYRHPFVGDGFPVPRNSETCLGRDGKPVPYDAFTVGPTNSNFSNRRIASAGMLYYRRIFRNCQTGKGGRSVIYFALPTIRTYFSPGQSNAPFTFYSVCYFTVSHKGSISRFKTSAAV